MAEFDGYPDRASLLHGIGEQRTIPRKPKARPQVWPGRLQRSDVCPINPTVRFCMSDQLKKILITAAIAVVAVIVYNKFIVGRVPGAPPA
jgi:hypothetical protein